MRIAKSNVGRISERIAMNELEARGFHIIDLAYVSKTAANVDFIASRNGQSANIQVKGMSNPLTGAMPRWSVQYGYCDDDIIAKRAPLYNGRTNFALEADVVVLVAVHAPHNYRCIVMSVQNAERAAQMNLDRYYRQPKLDGTPRKPGKIWIELDAPNNPRKPDTAKECERAFLRKHENKWEAILP